MSDVSESELKTYYWGGSSVIPRMDVRGNGVAYVHASADATDLSQLRKQFEAKGWATSSDVRNNDDNALRVSGFTSVQQIIDLLESSKAVEGAAQITTLAEDHKKGGRERLKSETLSAAGGSFLTGDILYGVSGVVNKDPMVGVGAFSLVGDLLLMTFGRHDERKEFASLIKKLKKHYEENGIDVPKDSALSIETSEKAGGLLAKTQNFLHEQVNPIKLILGIISGAFTIWTGYGKKGDPKKKRNPYRMAAGVSVASGYTASLLIKEKKFDPEKYQKASTLEKAWMKLQARPLQVASYMGLANNGFFIASMVKEWKSRVPSVGKKHYLWNEAGVAKIAGVSAMLFGNALYSISKKTTGGSIKSSAVVDDVYGLAAQVLDKMPASASEIAIKQTAEYLGTLTEIKDDRETIEARMRSEISAIKRNPWFATEGQYSRHALQRSDLTLGA